MSLAFQDTTACTWDNLLQDDTCGAIKRACCVGDADALLAILTSPKGKTVLRLYNHFASFAAINGHTSCLRVLHKFGFEFSSHAWDMAAQAGHVECLAFAVSHAYALEDSALEGAVIYGHLPCVDFLLQQGLPRKPYLHCGSRCILSPEHMKCIQQGSPPQPYMHSEHRASRDVPVLHPAMLDSGLEFMEFLLKHAMPREAYAHSDCRGVLRPAQMKCMQLIADKGVAINPKTLTDAANQGDLDFVRLLHGHGVPLWDLVLQEPPNLPCEGYVEPARRVVSPLFPGYAERPRTLVLYSYPRAVEDQLEDIWAVLRYGSVCGAPVSREMQELFEEKRRRTRAVLLCFKAAARLSTGPGSPREICAWAGMAALPPEIVGEMLVLADFEIRESVMRRVPLQAPTLAAGSASPT